MLTLIRSLARSPIIGGIIIALLIAAFALWGINDIFRGTGNAAILVGSERVTVQDLSRAYSRQLFQIQRENPRFTREQAEQVGLGESLVQQLTTQAALDAKAAELDLSISDAMLFDALESIPGFQNPFTNRFDPQTYGQILRDNGYQGPLAERQFETELADELRRNQYVTATLSGLAAPDIFARARQAYETERRTLRALLIPPSLVETPDAPDDATLEAFIAENARVFTQPEQRRLTLVRVQPSDFLRDVEVTEADLRELYAYQLETGELVDPATRSLTQWPAADQATAEAAAARIAAGESADAVAAELSLGDPAPIADVQAYQVPDAAIAEAAFAMTAGEVRAVEGRLGWRVVRIDAAMDPETPSFESIQDELRETLAGDAAEGMMLDALAVFEEARAAGATLEMAAADAGLPAERIDFITRNGFTLDEEPAITLMQAQPVLEAAFAAPLGFAGDLTEFGEGGYFVVRVDAVEESRLAALEDIREDATRFWTVRETDNRLQAIVDDAQARIASGEALERVAEDLGGGARVEVAILSRTETAGPFSAALVGQAFRVPAGQPFASRTEAQTTRAVVVVDEIIPGTGGRISPETRSTLTAELQDDASRIFASALINSYEVRADQVLIDQALGRTDPNL